MSNTTSNTNTMVLNPQLLEDIKRLEQNEKRLRIVLRGANIMTPQVFLQHKNVLGWTQSQLKQLKRKLRLQASK